MKVFLISPCLDPMRLQIRPKALHNRTIGTSVGDEYEERVTACYHDALFSSFPSRPSFDDWCYHLLLHFHLLK
jgi:hypothetical protein